MGSYTILACAAIGAKGYAFEPVPSTYARLAENLRLNHLEDRVKSFNMGIGCERGVLPFTSDRDTVNHALARGESAEGAVSVEVFTLDELLSGETPVLMKIDVEGFETPVLEGGEATLNKPGLLAVIMELNGSGTRYGYDEAAIVKKMSGHGFKCCSYDPFARKLIDLGGKNLASGNTLFIKGKEAVMERLKSAPKVLVNGREF